MLKIPSTYTFDASAKTITCADFTTLERINVIQNLNTGDTIYDFGDATKGGSLAGSVLTLDFNTAGMTDTDDLQIRLHTAVTTDELDARMAEFIARNPINGNGVPYITTARTKFRDAFLTYDTTNNWTTVQTGSGQAITVAGALNGARYLNIASGTTANAETIIISKQTFKAPSSIILGISMSQRIANCDLFAEIVEVDEAGTVINDTTIPSAVFLDAKNAAGFRFTGTTVTSQTVQVRQDGVSEESQALTLATTVATGTGPNFIPAGNYEITLRTRDIQFSSTVLNTGASKVAPSGSLRMSRVPNPDALYALRIRVKNGATGPLSTSDCRIHSVTILDDTRMSIDFGHVAGIPNPQNALPTQITNTPTVTASSTTGQAAIDAALAGNPVVAGVRASNARPTAMSADSDVNAIWADRHGAPIVEIGGPRGLKTNPTTTTITSSTAETTILAAVASTFNDVFMLVVSNTSATATVVTIRNATAGSAVWTIPLAAGEKWGFTLPSSDAVKQAVVNNNWTAQSSVSVASVVVTVAAISRV
jgi:hypothetical protein